MASNVFNKIADIKNDVKRNSFDWSHDNNLTTDLGRITPVFCELVPPNSSIRIKPSFGLRFMPMMFPIQTKMKAYLSFYKVPLRTLWKDYMDFISADNTEEFQPPFMQFQNTDFADGGCLAPSGLGDYFGIPANQIVSDALMGNPSMSDRDTANYTGVNVASFSSLSGTYKLGSAQDAYSKILPSYKDSQGGVNRDFYYVASQLGLIQWSGGSAVTVADESVILSFDFEYVAAAKNTETFDIIENYGFTFFSTASAYGSFKEDGTSVVAVNSVNIPAHQCNVTVSGATRTYRCHVELSAVAATVGSRFLYSVFFAMPGIEGVVNGGVSSAVTTLWGTRTFSNASVTRRTLNKSPYYSVGNQSDQAIKISAYPFRAYEAVYNAYIRNTRNNPFILNGKKTYNKWITNDEGGADSTTPKTLFMANWASDAYTTALTSPQQGTAPLVGLTTYEETTYNAETGHAETTIQTALVDEDGNAYKLGFESNGEALKGVTYTPLKTGELVNPQSLVSPVTSGISINDFRNVNAYQRYLELNQFRGFSYKEIVEGRFDVNVRYDALNMPEYLGGITRDIIVNPITQTVETSVGTYQGALGSQAGFATCLGDTNQSISVFCDEESIILGIMYVVPMPVYDSLLPKWLTYRDRLDSFNPEFDHIGYQPIKVSELAAVQAYGAGVDLNTVFGYQRPWYEYVQKCDRAHGLFLSSLRNFIMYRSWNNVPELGKDFTTMKPGDVNNVFSVTEVSDKILGQIHFDCTAQLPISRVVVPRLE